MTRRAVAKLVIVLSIVCAVAGWWFAENRSGKRIYQEYVALDGREVPQVSMEPSWSGPEAVVLYRMGRNGVVCFDIFRSKELHDSLVAKNGQAVTVVYDTIGDHGPGRGYRGYSVHSVDGLVLAHGEDQGAGVAGGKRADGSFRAGPEDCW